MEDHVQRVPNYEREEEDQVGALAEAWEADGGHCWGGDGMRLR